MAEQILLEVEPRAATGTSASRRLRRLGDQVPGIVYGGGEDPVMIALPYRALSKAMQQPTFFSQVLNLSVDGAAGQPAVVRALQRHPATDKVLHVDFLRVRADRAVQMAVPLKFINEDKCVGARAGGMITHNLIEVEISCLPAQLPEHLEVDVAELEVGQSLHLSDVVLPAGVSIVALAQGAAHDVSVVTVQTPRGGLGEDEEEAQEDAAPEEGEAPTEPE